MDLGKDLDAQAKEIGKNIVEGYAKAFESCPEDDTPEARHEAVEKMISEGLSEADATLFMETICGLPSKANGIKLR